MAHISIEAEVWEISKIKYPNQLSSIIEDFLRGLNYSEIIDKKGISSESIEQQEKVIQKEIINLKIAAKELDLTKKQQIEDIKQIEQKKQEEVQKKRFCFNCGNPIGILKVYTTPKGNICKTCFFQATKEQIREWSLNA